MVPCSIAVARMRRVRVCSRWERAALARRAAVDLHQCQARRETVRSHNSLSIRRFPPLWIITIQPVPIAHPPCAPAGLAKPRPTCPDSAPARSIPAPRRPPGRPGCQSCRPRAARGRHRSTGHQAPAGRGGSHGDSSGGCSSIRTRTSGGGRSKVVSPSSWPGMSRHPPPAIEAPRWLELALAMTERAGHDVAGSSIPCG
jgi:hypothetical protein